MHEELFIRQHRWISQLRVRATIGQTGNQTIGSTAGVSVFRYLPGGNFFGPGMFMESIGNQDLEWQKTLSSNLALNMNLFNNRFIGKFEIYQKRTGPMVIGVSQVPSVGITTKPLNVGILTYNGFEFDVTYHIIRAKDFSWRARVMGSVTRGMYSKFGEALEKLNEEMQDNNQLQRFNDGFSPETIWAVRSLGIDPGTGREIFLSKEGIPTFLFDSRDAVPVGTRQPKTQGTINMNFVYKQLSLGVVMRYKIGGEIFNSAIFQKVENISGSQLRQNLDARALYLRWHEPGDETQFKSIANSSFTQMSSRFVQTENVLSGESINIQWRLTKRDNPWLGKYGLERLTFSSNITATGGVFRMSNVLRERGTQYPEATTISLSISAAF
jgi:hypothetical protein